MLLAIVKIIARRMGKTNSISVLVVVEMVLMLIIIIAGVVLTLIVILWKSLLLFEHTSVILSSCALTSLASRKNTFVPVAAGNSR